MWLNNDPVYILLTTLETFIVLTTQIFEHPLLEGAYWLLNRPISVVFLTEYSIILPVEGSLLAKHFKIHFPFSFWTNLYYYIIFMCWDVMGMGYRSVLSFCLEMKTSHGCFHIAKLKTTQSNDVFSCNPCLNC